MSPRNLGTQKIRDKTARVALDRTSDGFVLRPMTKVPMAKSFMCQKTQQRSRYTIEKQTIFDN